MCSIDLCSFSYCALLSNPTHTSGAAQLGLQLVFEKLCMMFDIPNTQSIAYVLTTHTHLWCSVVGAATAGLQEVTITHDVGQTEVSNLDVHLCVQQQVFGLQVSVHDALVVQELWRSERKTGTSLIESFVLLVARIHTQAHKNEETNKQTNAPQVQ